MPLSIKTQPHSAITGGSELWENFAAIQSYVNSLPTTGGTPNPWTETINADNHDLISVGKLGIGLSDPIQPLTVKISVSGQGISLGKTSDLTTGQFSFIGNTGADGSFNGGLISGGDNGASGMVLVHTAAGDASGQSTDLAFFTHLAGSQSSEKVRVTSAGKVGIGTSSPSDPLTVNGSARLTSGQFNVDAGSAYARDGLYAGAVGHAGFIFLYPATSAKGGLQFLVAPNSGDTTTVVTNADFGQASTLTIPDPGSASANFVLGLSPLADQIPYGVRNGIITGSNDMKWLAAGLTLGSGKKLNIAGLGSIPTITGPLITDVITQLGSLITWLSNAIAGV